MQAIPEGGAEGVVIVDEDGRIQAASREACALLGRDAGELVGAPWRDLSSVEHTAYAVDVRTVCVLHDRRARQKMQRQIGHDLHDGLGQILTGTAFLAKGLEAHVDAAYRPQAQRVVELINLAIARVRGLARGLSSLHVEARGLSAVLRDVVAEGAELLGVQTVLELDAALSVEDPAMVAQLQLIVREAITNAVRHGRADRIVVRLARQGERAALSIEDNGIGIPESPVEGLGLKIMRERAAAIGGVLEVARAAVGTVVRCWF